MPFGKLFQPREVSEVSLKAFQPQRWAELVREQPWLAWLHKARKRCMLFQWWELLLAHPPWSFYKMFNIENKKSHTDGFQFCCFRIKFQTFYVAGATVIYGRELQAHYTIHTSNLGTFVLSCVSCLLGFSVGVFWTVWDLKTWEAVSEKHGLTQFETCLKCVAPCWTKPWN